MATIILVHGTFAHAYTSDANGEQAPAELQWWQPGSALENDLKTLLDPASGKLDIIPFEWTGENSERDRRKGGKELLALMRSLEAKGERYAVVGHSHGGSVVAAALLRAAAEKQKLPNLARWITVGTPFITMKRESLLFTRLDLMRKVILVASMMLFAMFLVYLVAQVLSGKEMVLGGRIPGIFLVTGVMMSLPALFFYLVLRWFDSRSLLLHRRRVITRAREYFAARWLSFAHRDDEAIQGLSYLPRATLSFFDRGFAVPMLTVASVIALPLIYIALVTSPTKMVALADWLKTDIYESRVGPETETALRSLVRQRVEMGRGPTLTQEERRAAWRDYREKRRKLAASHDDLDDAERAIRFKQRFLERTDVACENGQLCGGGRDIRINSALLLHVVTDELTWHLGGDAIGQGRSRWLWSVLIPAILVPIIFGLVSLAMMMVIKGVSTMISIGSSRMLNAMTNAEVKRSAFGNDTEGEIATGAMDRPPWLELSPPRLPTALADLVTEYSNSMATRSLAKFRRAIGQIASAEPQHSAETAITTYFTWKELVHASYFDVPQFRALLAQALSRIEGLAPSAAFKASPDYARSAQWLAEVEGAPGTTQPVAAAPPTVEDVGAVATAVASTVKAAP